MKLEELKWTVALGRHLAPVYKDRKRWLVVALSDDDEHTPYYQIWHPSKIYHAVSDPAQLANKVFNEFEFALWLADCTQTLTPRSNDASDDQSFSQA